MTTFHPSFEAAMSLNRMAGFTVMPLQPHSKLPMGGWAHLANKPQTVDEAARLFRPYALNGCNIAAIGGTRSTSGRNPFAAIDIDDPARVDETVRAARRACDAMPALVQTGEGFQIIIKTRMPVATTVHDGKWGEVRGLGAYAVMPPSIHPNGRAYTWLQDPDRIPTIKHPHYLLDIGVKIESAYEIGAGMLAGVQVGNPAHVSGDYHKLPRLAQAIIAGNTRATGRYSTRSECDFALFASLANTGMQADEIAGWALISKHDASYKTDTQGKPRRDTLRRIYYGIAKAQEFVKRTSPEWAAVQCEVKEARIWAWATAWAGQGGSRGETRRAAYLAHLDTASNTGRLEYHLSKRDGATLARMGGRAFLTANRTLISDALINCTRHATTTDSGIPHAARYTLHLPPQTTNTASQRTPYTASPNDTHDPRQASLPNSVNVGEWFLLNKTAAGDAFEWGGLGRSALAVYVSLLAQPGTQGELAARIGITQPTVSRALARLQLHELAECKGRKWQATERSDDWFKALAKRLGTHGRGKRRAIENQNAQRAYRRMIADKKKVTHDTNRNT